MEQEILSVKELRNHYHLTQQKLSEITGIPVRTIENWETDNRKPPPYIPGLIQAKLELDALIKLLQSPASQR